MHELPALPERRIDKAAVLVCAAMLAALYVFLFRVLDGGWMNMVRDGGRMIVPVLVYLGLVASILVPVARRGGNTRRWWVLCLLPVCGALSGIVAHLLEPGRGPLLAPMVAGAWYGVMHALYLHWAWRRDARRADPAAA
jgi:hypothetical protein